MAGRIVTNLSEEKAFGQLLEGMMKELQLAPPYMYGYQYLLPSDNLGWIVHVDIAARVEPTPGPKVEFRVVKGTWERAVEEATRQALADIALSYRRDLANTPYRFFPKEE